MRIINKCLCLSTYAAVKILNELNEKRTENGAKTLPIITLKTAPPTLSSPDSRLVDAIDCCVPNTEVEEGQYSDVALGGTFDHLHAGHKILLSMTAWVTSHRIVCGVSGMQKENEYLTLKLEQSLLRILTRGGIFDV